MKIDYSLIVTTASDKKSAEKIAEILVKKKLSACVQMLPIKSFYIWKNKLQKDNEVLMLIKTQTIKFKEVEKTIKKINPYEVPEVLEIKINRGNKNYLDWILKSTLQNTTIYGSVLCLSNESLMRE